MQVGSDNEQQVIAATSFIDFPRRLNGRLRRRDLTRAGVGQSFGTSRGIIVSRLQDAGAPPRSCTRALRLGRACSIHGYANLLQLGLCNR